MTLLTLLRGSGDARPEPPSAPIRVRERMPLGIHVTSDAPGGATHRWGRDEPAAADRPSGERWSDTMPGGFDRFGCVLPRKPGVDYGDLKPMTTLTARNHAGSCIWQGRLERIPVTSGDQMAVSPDAVGWQAHLEDDRSASCVYVDRDLGRWQGPSSQRRLNLIAAGRPHMTDASAVWDESASALTLSISGAWTSPIPVCEAWYDAGAGNRVGRIRCEFSGPSDLAFVALALTSSDAVQTSAEGTGDFFTTTSGAIDFQPSLAGWHRFAFFRWDYSASGGAEAALYELRLRRLAVYGDHGLTEQSGGGFLTSDIAAHAVGRWAPMLRFSTGPNGTIQPSSFPVPHAAFHDPTTVAAIFQEVLKYELPDWAVWDDRWLYMHPRGARGRRWRARVAASGLEETGPQIDRIWNGILVQFQDVDGSARTVGPPGSGVDVEDPQLLDTDPENPANQLNIRRWDILQMGIVSTAAGAIQVGARFLAESRLLSTAGRATLTGYVMDEHGVLWPYHEVRAGDSVSFVDAADPSWRRITQAEKDASSRSCTVSLDSPPEGLGALLARWGLTLVPLGL